MPKPNNRHILVVGGTKGIGGEVARELVRAGHAVTALGRTNPKSGHKRIRVLRANLARTRTLPALVKHILRTRDKIHGIVFLQRFRPPGDAWQTELDVSLTATRLLIELILEGDLDKSLRSIVVVGSVAGRMVAEEQPVGYHVAKGGLLQMVRYYACELGPKNIRVNCVSPGVILKPEAEQYYRLNKELRDLYEQLAPLRRFGTAADVAKVVKFLCSDDSSFVTGQDITVDGGISLIWQASLARKLVPITVPSIPQKPF
jgi:NAD(P)-dependent dehydrogenase (short-subunit alcohol dehydrogenase family)